MVGRWTVSNVKKIKSTNQGYTHILWATFYPWFVGGGVEHCLVVEHGYGVSPRTWSATTGLQVISASILNQVKKRDKKEAEQHRRDAALNELTQVVQDAGYGLREGEEV